MGVNNSDNSEITVFKSVFSCPVSRVVQNQCQGTNSTRRTTGWKSKLVQFRLEVMHEFLTIKPINNWKSHLLRDSSSPELEIWKAVQKCSSRRYRLDAEIAEYVSLNLQEFSFFPVCPQKLCAKSLNKTLSQYHIAALKVITLRSNTSKPKQIKPILADSHTFWIMLMLSDTWDMVLLSCLEGKQCTKTGIHAGVKWWDESV